MKGIIIINKPPGKTSHQMVSFLRRLTGVKRIGHTGTLDPDATGVLPMCIGKATRAAAYITAEDKHYRAVLVLGSATDTADASGNVVETRPVTVTEEQILQAAACFTGEIQQIPPMYSAIKVGGKKLYELARKGVEIERTPRQVKIFSIDITQIDLANHTVTMEVHCSKGTYIRSLCADMGEHLGCLGHMGSLVRTKTGDFTLESSYTTEQLEELAGQGILSHALIKLDQVFEAYPPIYLSAQDEKRVRNGVSVNGECLCESQLYRLYGEDGQLLCLSKACDDKLVMETSFWDEIKQ